MRTLATAALALNLPRDLAVHLPTLLLFVRHTHRSGQGGRQPVSGAELYPHGQDPMAQGSVPPTPGLSWSRCGVSRLVS